MAEKVSATSTETNTTDEVTVKEAAGAVAERIRSNLGEKYDTIKGGVNHVRERMGNLFTKEESEALTDEELEPVAALEAARGEIAKLGARRQYGVVTPNQLKKAESQYFEAMGAYITELSEDADNEEQRQIAAEVVINERFMRQQQAEENLDQSTAHKFLNWYGKQKWYTQTALGVAFGAAATGAAATAIAGGALAATTVGTRLFKRFVREKSKKASTTESADIQEEQDQALRESIGDIKKPGHRFKPGEMAERALAQAREAEGEDAEKKAGKSMVKVATFVGGLALGNLAGEYINDLFDNAEEASDELAESGADGSESAEALDTTADAEAAVDATADTDTGAETLPLVDEEGNFVEDDATEAATEAEFGSPDYLFKDLAGKEVSIDIPEGSNIWDQLEALPELQGESYDERQRIVGNIVNKMQEQYPGRDLDLVHPGENFSVKLPS